MPRDYRARTLGGGNATLLIPSSPGTCPPPPPDPRPPQCAIKGNIGGQRGQPRIYHMPGSVATKRLQSRLRKVSEFSALRGKPSHADGGKDGDEVRARPPSHLPRC